MEQDERNLDRLAVKLSTAARLLDCGTTTVHNLARAGKLEVVHIGADRRITVRSIQALIAAQLGEQLSPAPALRRRSRRKSREAAEGRAT